MGVFTAGVPFLICSHGLSSDRGCVAVLWESTRCSRNRFVYQLLPKLEEFALSVLLVKQTIEHGKALRTEVENSRTPMLRLWPHHVVARFLLLRQCRSLQHQPSIDEGLRIVLRISRVRTVVLVLILVFALVIVIVGIKDNELCCQLFLIPIRILEGVFVIVDRVGFLKVCLAQRTGHECPHKEESVEDSSHPTVVVVLLCGKHILGEHQTTEIDVSPDTKSIPGDKKRIIRFWLRTVVLSGWLETSITEQVGSHSVHKQEEPGLDSP